MIYVIIGLFALFIATFIYAVCQHGFNKSLKDQLERKTEMYNGLREEFEIYRNAEKFKAQKEEEVNEKVDDLHSGKLSADDILPKR